MRGKGHFRQSDVEGEGGFGALIFVEAIVMQAIGAATGGGVVEGSARSLRPRNQSNARLASRDQAGSEVT